MSESKPRTCANWKAEPISETLFAELTAAVAGKVGAERVRPALLINAGGIEKVIDNAADARETIRRGDGKRTENGPRWENPNPGKGSNSTHVARARAKRKRTVVRSVRHQQNAIARDGSD